MKFASLLISTHEINDENIFHRNSISKFMKKTNYISNFDLSSSVLTLINIGDSIKMKLKYIVLDD